MDRYEVGQRVYISKKNIQTMINSNRSICALPSDSFINHIRMFYNANAVGMITFIFPPGYEYTVEFDGAIFHMKHHWVTPLEKENEE